MVENYNNKVVYKETREGKIHFIYDEDKVKEH